VSTVAYIGFGANLGDRHATFQEALLALRALPLTVVTATSRVYETKPINISDGGPAFFNAVIELNTDLSVRDLMSHMRGIELRLGKSVSHRSDLSRVVDLDLLLYGECRISEDSIEVPHPRIQERAFVLVPLAEVAPHAVHPVLRRTADAMCGLLSREDLLSVRPLSPLTPPVERDASGSP